MQSSRQTRSALAGRDSAAYNCPFSPGNLMLPAPLMPCQENADVDHPPHPHQDRSVRGRECRAGLESGMRAAHDPAKGVHFGKAAPLKDAPEFISYSEWDSEAAIEAYRNSAAHKEIVRHARALKGAKAEVKLYDLVQ